MKIALAPAQLLQIAATAVNASSPVGLGILHMQNKTYTPKDVLTCIQDSVILRIDYFDGRMVKLTLRPDTDGLYEIPDRLPDSEYQSWCSKYPTYKALIDASIG